MQREKDFPQKTIAILDTKRPFSLVFYAFSFFFNIWLSTCNICLVTICKEFDISLFFEEYISFIQNKWYLSCHYFSPYQVWSLSQLISLIIGWNNNVVVYSCESSVIKRIGKSQWKGCEVRSKPRAFHTLFDISLREMVDKNFTEDMICYWRKRGSEGN